MDDKDGGYLSVGTQTFLCGVLGLCLPSLWTQYAGDLGIRPILSPFAIESLTLRFQDRPNFALISAPSTLLSHMFVHDDFLCVIFELGCQNPDKDSDNVDTL